MALGVGLTYRTYGFFNIAHAAVFAVGPYILYGVLTIARVPFLGSLLISVIAVAALGLICHIAVFQPLRQRRATSLSLLLASVGLLFTLEGLLSLFFGAEPISLPGHEVIEGLGILGARITKTQVVILALTMVVSLCWWLISRKTRYGLFMRAIAADEGLARIVGVRTNSIIRLGLIASSLTVGVSGILKGYDTGVTPTMGFEVFFAAVVAVMIGGGIVTLEILTAFSLGVIQQFAVLVVPTQWQDVIVFLALLVFLLIRPQEEGITLTQTPAQ